MGSAGPVTLTDPKADRSSAYDPQGYWSNRLGEHFDLRGTGHLDYDARYNRWLYREKARALRWGLDSAREGDSVLDVGSGVGWVVDQLLSRGLSTEGCDISPDAVHRLSNRFPAARFFQLSLGTDPIPRPDGSYDVVTMLDVAYHVTDDQLWLEGLREVARVLRPGGRLIISDGLGPADRTPAPHVRFRSATTWGQADAVGLTISGTRPYFRWLSRDKDAWGFRHLPDGVRGAVEYGLERLVRRPPHMRCAVLTRS